MTRNAFIATLLVFLGACIGCTPPSGSYSPRQQWMIAADSYIVTVDFLSAYIHDHPELSRERLQTIRSSCVAALGALQTWKNALAVDAADTATASQLEFQRSYGTLLNERAIIEATAAAPTATVTTQPAGRSTP